MPTTASNTVQLDGKHLELEALESIVLGEARAEITPDARSRVAAAREFVDSKFDRGDAIYGVTTGFGRLANVTVAPEDAGALERVLIHFPEVAERAAKELEPHYVTTYLTELASAFNSWYASERVIGGTHQQYGVLLATAVEQTLKKGLQVLGIPAPEEM